MEDLGRKIKELRKSRDMSQEDLAEKLDISRSNISNIENSRRSVNLKQLQKLCEIFKVDMEFWGVSPTAEESISLLERAKLIFEADSVPDSDKDNLYQELMRVYLKSKE